MTPQRKTGGAKKSTTSKAVVSVRLYRRIAVTFIILTAFLFVFILYLSFSKASIIIETDHEIVSLDFSVNIEKEPSSEGAIQGEVASVIIQGEFEEETTGTVEEKEGVARGVVTILNKTSNNQVLIKTTRLLTSDDKLFRLDEEVTVPAGGKVEARIYANEAGEDGVVGPALFTIPGLWEGLQDKIYAESVESTSISAEEIKVVSQEDLNRVSNKLRNQLLEQGKEELELTILGDWSGQEFTSEIIEEEFDVETGEQAESLNLYMELRIVGILYDKDELRNIAKNKLEESISSDVELTKIDYEKMRVDITRYDLSVENAGLKIFINGDTVLKSSSQIFDKNRLVGMDKQTVIDYFKDFDSIKSVTIELKPFWLKRIPELRDHIEIRIKR